jgi:hypothetical protein
MKYLFLLTLLFASCADLDQRPRPAPLPPTIAVDNSPKLELIDSRGDNLSDKFSEINGRVRNVSNIELDMPKVVITVYDEKGQFQQSDYGFLQINPFKPGQVSPFKVTLMNVGGRFRYDVTFTTFSGDEIPFRNSVRSKN